MQKLATGLLSEIDQAIKKRPVSQNNASST